MINNRVVRGDIRADLTVSNVSHCAAAAGHEQLCRSSGAKVQVKVGESSILREAYPARRHRLVDGRQTSLTDSPDVHNDEGDALMLHNRHVAASSAGGSILQVS